MNNIKLSIIVPVYNVAPYLRECLDSILYDIAKDTEVIIIDDGSTDESGKICDEYARREASVRVLHQSNAGLSAARNAGLSAARGIYVYYVDSDDYISSRALNRIIELMDKEHADVAVADFSKILHSEKMVPDNQFYSKVDSKIITPEDFLLSINKNMLVVWNKVYRRETFKDILFPVGATYEDIYYFNHVLQQTKKMIYVPIVLYYYRLQRKGNTATTFRKKGRLLGYPFMIDFAEYVKKNYNNEVYTAVAKYVANFFQAQYYECRTLSKNKELYSIILKTYRKYIKDVPFRIFPLWMSIFRISPSLYTLIKKSRS